MKQIADALVYAVTYINGRQAIDEIDDDVGALESIAGYLANASSVEKLALTDAAKRALAEELASPSPRPEFVSILTDWVSNMLGDE